MTWPIEASELLEGPRGRVLCWGLIQTALHEASDWAEREEIWSAAQRGDLSGAMAGLTEAAADAAQAVLADDDEAVLLAVLAAVAQGDSYWQEPDPEDIALDDPAVQAALLPVAQAVARTPATAWWATSMDPATQQLIAWPGLNPLALTGVPGALARWRADEEEDERAAAKRPADPAAPWGGHWWSTPALGALPQTSRSLPGAGPVGLALVDDPMGWPEARCQPVRPVDGVRCYEIDGPESWAGLVTRYPFEVSKSRRHDWWRLTGWAGPWLIPDYAAVAADFDAVHLTVLGYLTTAGRALAAGEPGAGARTVLAGWAPDTTYWLADVLSPAGPATEWVTEDNGLFWTQAS